MIKGFKGTYMSLGHFCATSEILSRIGVRESGLFDWAENKRGLSAFVDVLTGAFQHNIENNLVWTSSICYDKMEDGVVEKITRRVPCVNGLEFTHMPYHDINQIKKTLMERANKVKAFAESGGKFVYACLSNEEPYKGYVLDMLDVWFSQRGFDTDEKLLMIPYGVIDDYYNIPLSERVKHVDWLKEKLIEHNNAPLTIRSDYVEKYNNIEVDICKN